MYVLCIFLPLVAAFIAGMFGRFIGDRGAQYVTCGGLIVSALIAPFMLYDVAVLGHARDVVLTTWIASGDLELSWALRFDSLSAVMVFVVTVISALIHVYSVGYMDHDPHKPRFMAYLSLFTFSMLMLVTADNLIQMFFGWEGVGLCSYLLIGFWYHKPSANDAAIKAFIVNRIGDFGFALGIFGTFLLFQSVSFTDVFAAVPGKANATLHFLNWDFHALTVLCLLLFIGAMGKSAQLGLHTWLPDAMEGPTPVSALIHAATMVTAGVFLVCRLSPMFEYAPAALNVVCIVGAATAFFAATVGLVQNDIKRVIAYSTCSQLGYMFFAAGVSAYGAAMFHLYTHAFFKALLFLGAGSVIHAMSGEQDMRKMGGIWKKVPYTYAVMWIGSLALAGVPFFAGFYSKDMILEAAFAAHSGVGLFAYAMGTLAAFMTAFYSWRLLLMTFHGSPRADHHTMEHVHEALGHADPAVRAGGGRDVRRIPGLQRLRRRGAGRFLGQGAHGAAGARYARSRASRRAVGQAAAAGHGAGGHRAGLCHVRAAAGLAGGFGRAVPRALFVPAQQVVLRRAVLERAGRAGDAPWPRLMEGRRRRDHRRPWPRRHRQHDPGPGAPRRAVADRLSLSLRLRDADRRGSAGVVVFAGAGGVRAR
jgi:NADH-quinone oxidoreductase subunit L